MAGLPKVLFALFLTMGMFLTLAFVGAAQDVLIDPIDPLPVDVQTPSIVLQPVFDMIDANLIALPADQEILKTDFENAVTLGVLTPEQAVAMLELVQWTSLVDPEELTNAAAAIETILAELISGALTPEDDPIAELTNLLNALATPAGTLTAIGKAGASDEVLDQVSSLVAGGVPPGILVQITKKGLRDGLSMDEILAQLDALAASIPEEGEPSAWGTLAHDITGEGEYRDQEQNENVSGNEEPEEESNEHGASNGNKDDNPGNGQDKGKKDK
ncbi:hypothetical protein IH601_03690 [Candidatus Bipolaricaulota bacterium]|nr:hypothetical protein [Candidatus Bipolaricaulota bacterium]